jgi:hypothetical protein
MGKGKGPKPRGLSRESRALWKNEGTDDRTFEHFSPTDTDIGRERETHLIDQFAPTIQHQKHQTPKPSSSPSKHVRIVNQHFAETQESATIEQSDSAHFGDEEYGFESDDAPFTPVQETCTTPTPAQNNSRHSTLKSFYDASKNQPGLHLRPPTRMKLPRSKQDRHDSKSPDSESNDGDAEEEDGGQWMIDAIPSPDVANVQSQTRSGRQLVVMRPVVREDREQAKSERARKGHGGRSGGKNKAHQSMDVDQSYFIRRQTASKTDKTSVTPKRARVTDQDKDLFTFSNNGRRGNLFELLSIE